MRERDRDEVRASGGFSPMAALHESLRLSEFARTVFIAGEPAAMLGVAIVGNQAVPWLLTTDAVDRYPCAFYRAAKTVLATIAQVYGELVQFVDARYPQALRFVEQLGFEVLPAIPFGAEQRPFHPIRLTERS